MENWLSVVGVGVVAGLAANVYTSANGFGEIARNFMLGLTGAVAGAWLFSVFLNHGSRWFGSTVVAFFGAVAVLFFASLFMHRGAATR